MTALAMMIGMVPMAIGLGEGGEQNCAAGPRGDRRIAVCHHSDIVFRTVRVFDYPWMAGAPQHRSMGAEPAIS